MTDVLYPSDPPAMRIENTWIQSSLGETAVLQCQVSANPVPKVNKSGKFGKLFKKIVCR